MSSCSSTPNRSARYSPPSMSFATHRSIPPSSFFARFFESRRVDLFLSRALLAFELFFAPFFE